MTSCPAIHDVGAWLLNSLGAVLQRSFAGDGATGDPRFPHALPTTVRAHVLMTFIQAHDSYGLSLSGFREHASASALGCLRAAADGPRRIRSGSYVRFSFHSSR
jgi:hypothetical protein